MAQGIPYGFVTVALAAWLAGRGGSAAEAVGTVIALAVLPWSFKWAWGPVVDSGLFASLGRRRPWLLLAQAMMVVTGLLLALSGGDTARLGWLVLLHNVFVGLQDVAIDALAVDMLEGKQRERASGMMFGAAYAGTILGGAGLGLVMARHGLTAAVIVMAAIQAATFVVVLLVRERPGDLLLPAFGAASAAAARPAALAPTRLLGGLAVAMVRPAALRTGVGAVMLKVLPAMLYVIMTVRLFGELGWTEARFAEVSGGFGNLVGFLAAVAAGFLAASLGPKTVLVAADSILAASWILLAAVPRLWEHEMTIWVWFGIHEGCLAFVSVSLFALFMRVSTPAVAATQFTASMALMNLATSFGSWLSGPVSASLDAPTAFLVAGLLQPLGALLVPDARGDGTPRPEETPAGPAAAGSVEAVPPPGAVLATAIERPRAGAWRVAAPALVVLASLAPPACGAETDVATTPEAWREGARRAQRESLGRLAWRDNLDTEWFLEQVPHFECADADIETTWWYRQELLTKHLTYGSPDTGWVFTEFLDRPFWSGRYGAIACPAGHQIAEARWLRSPRIARDYVRYWVNTPGAQPRNYSNWLVDATWGLHLVHPAKCFLGLASAAAGDDVFPLDVRAGLEANERGWDERHLVAATGLHWQTGHDDGMEFNVASRQTTDILRGAPSYRPSFLAYRFAERRALAKLADLAGDDAGAAAHRARAEDLRERTETLLWDERREFFLAAFRDDETADGFTVRAGTRIHDTGRFAGSPHGRELIGYVPWMFDMPSRGKGYERAWKFLADPEFFQAPFGPSTVERHDPMFLLQPHCCWWSGQSWPYATAQTLSALARVLQERSPGFDNSGDDLQSFVTADDYVALLATFARSHRKGGRPYLAEALHPDTGSFEGHDGYSHSEHYFHSSYCDQVITGLAGLVPRADDTLEIRPLFPEAWSHLRLDRVVYRGREIAVVWDKTGSRYGLGAGLHLLADGRPLASSPHVGRLVAALPPPADPGLTDDGLRPGLAPERVNLAVNNDGTYFPRALPSSTAPGTSPARLVDGVAWYLRSPPNRWESAVAGEPATIVVDFGTPRRIDEIRLALLDDDPGLLAGTADAAVPGRDRAPSDVRAPESIRLESRDGESWVEIATRARLPERPLGHRANRLAFAPREVTALRVTLVPEGSSRVGLAELECWGDAIRPVAPAPPPRGNLALNPGGADAPDFPRASASHTSRYDGVERAIDGVVSFAVNPNNRWTAYESASASDWLEIDFGTPKRFSRVELALYDDRGGVQPPERFHVEVWRDGAWKRVEGETHEPEQPLGNALNEIRFDRVETEKLRIVFTHRGAARSGVSEVFVWEE